MPEKKSTASKLSATNNTMSAKSSKEQAISVWLIEDNHTFRNTIAKILSRVADIGAPRDFSNSEDALEALTQGIVPDVALVDVELPGIDGIEAVRRIKSMSPATRIIMLTVFDDHDKIFKAICAGASGYLLKTSPVEKIVESVREAYAGGAPMTPRVARSVLDMFVSASLPHPDYGLTA